jgi:Icc-related predicted phosphoesterase
MTVQILAVSDQIDPRIHSASIRARMPDVQLVFGCGDLPARYLEFLADALEKPVYFVLGNHMEEWTRHHETGKPYDPMGGINLDGNVTRDQSTGLLIGGLPGSPKYSGEGGQQFTEWQMSMKILKMLPGMTRHRIRRGRWLDVLLTHAPPRDVNDGTDVAHRGFKSIRWFLNAFKPAYHLHGHIHLYDRNIPNVTQFGDVQVINVYPYQKLDLDIPHLGDAGSGV